MYHWITLLYTQTNSIVNQLYFNKKIKKQTNKNKVQKGVSFIYYK